MTQPTITSEIDIAARSAALDVLHDWNLTLPAARSTMFELVKDAAYAAASAAAPHIAAQALRQAAEAITNQTSFSYGDSGDPSDWAGAVARFVRERADEIATSAHPRPSRLDVIQQP